MITNITLNYIKSRWNPAGSKNSRDFCQKIFPDIYCKALCHNSEDYYLDATADGQGVSISNSTLAGIMRGNRKSKTDGSSPAGNFTGFFIENLQRNSEIEYLASLNRDATTFRENMFLKIYSAVHTMASPRSADHPLFQDRDFDTTSGCSDEIQMEYQKVNYAISVLLEKETEVTISYAIFLLVVTAFVQDRIIELRFLYEPESIEKVFEYDVGPRFFEISNKAFSPFSDPDYMNHTYNLYLFREATKELWHAASLTMELTESEHQRPSATMILSDGITSPIVGDREMVRTYTGTPMFSKRDQAVYIAMSDQKDTFAFLSFPYKMFNFSPMYYRNAFLFIISPESRNPQFQKVAIVARKLSDAELPYVKGLLKMDDNQLLLTEAQLSLFMQQYAEEEWMPDFQKNYFPLFEKHKRIFYCFSDDEILSCSVSDLEPEERIKVLLALKSVEPPNHFGENKFLQCSSPKGTHKLFK